MIAALSAYSQDVIYSSLPDLLSGAGDTVTTLKVQKRSTGQIYLSGGADYHIYSTDNEGISKYLKKRSYAVRYRDTLYVNCRQLRYKKYRFGNWFARAILLHRHVFFIAQPLGQLASSSLIDQSEPRLQGSVGDAISASNLIYDRVVYEIKPGDGSIDFVGKTRMSQLLGTEPEMLDEYLAENSEHADVVMKYLLRLH